MVAFFSLWANIDRIKIMIGYYKGYTLHKSLKNGSNKYVW